MMGSYELLSSRPGLRNLFRARSEQNFQFQLIARWSTRLRYCGSAARVSCSDISIAICFESHQPSEFLPFQLLLLQFRAQRACTAAAARVNYVLHSPKMPPRRVSDIEKTKNTCSRRSSCALLTCRFVCSLGSKNSFHNSASVGAGEKNVIGNSEKLQWVWIYKLVVFLKLIGKTWTWSKQSLGG